MVRQWIANPLSPVRIWVPPEIILSYSIAFRFKFIYSTIWKVIIFISSWECGEIGRHDGLKIRCRLNGVRVQVPPFPLIRLSYSILIKFKNYGIDESYSLEFKKIYGTMKNTKKVIHPNKFSLNSYIHSKF